MLELAVVVAIESPNHRSRLSYNRPHPMLPILGKPLVVRMMNQLHQQGIEKYVVILGPDGGSAAAYLSQSWLPDVNLEFIVKPPGIGLGEKLARIARSYQRPFVIASYHNFTPPNFVERLTKVHQEDAAALVVGGAGTSLSFETRGYFGAVDKRVITAISRQTADEPHDLRLMDFAICGGAFRDYLLTDNQRSNRQQSIMDLFVDYLDTGRQALAAEAAWMLSVESDADLMTLNRQLLDENRDAHILSEIPVSVQVVPPVRIDPQVSVGQGAIIGPYVYLESGCSVGPEAHIQHSLVLAKGSISAHEAISHMIVSSRHRIPV